jgi:hypothetical protein
MYETDVEVLFSKKTFLMQRDNQYTYKILFELFYHEGTKVKHENLTSSQEVLWKKFTRIHILNDAETQWRQITHVAC